MKLDLQKYNNLNRYVRNGKECIFDKTKQILRNATPEEEIRQRVVEFLNDKMEIPFKAMETEIPVCYFIDGARGRMDVVVYGLKDNQRYPIMVVECKAAAIHMTENVYIQAKKYSEVIDIPVLMVTNGSDVDILAWNYGTEEYEAVEYFPTYDELCKPEDLKGITLQEVQYERHEYLDLFKDEIIDLEFEYGEYIGESCKRSMVPYVVNLAESFMDTSHKAENLEIKGYKFIKDGGIRYTSFGNTSGGSFTGFYRYFIIEDTKGDTQIISMSVAGCMNGRSLLIVAIDDMDKHHNSLQLSIEHFSSLSDKKLKIWHDGTLTVGNKGKAKKQEVIDFVENNSSLKVENGKIQLGEIDMSDLVYANDNDMKELIANLIEYAMVRDDFRKMKKGTMC